MKYPKKNGMQKSGERVEEVERGDIKYVGIKSINMWGPKVKSVLTIRNRNN